MVGSRIMQETQEFMSQVGVERSLKGHREASRMSNTFIKRKKM